MEVPGMDAEKQKLTPEQLKDVTGGESAWWTGDTSTYLYICHNCWHVYGSGETPDPCPNCGSTDVGYYV
jgi:rubrerythrin